MKKYLAIAMCILFAVSGISAQTADTTTSPAVPDAAATDKTAVDNADTSSIQVITPENQHTTNKTAKVSIEYSPLTDEVRIYYTCMDVTFDQGDSMNTIYACLEDFKKQNQYYGYKFLSKDKIRYFKDARNVKMVSYMSYVQMTR